MIDRSRQFSLALLTIGCLLAPMAVVKAQPTGPNPNAPADASTVLERVPGQDYLSCQFPIKYIVTGKAKLINLPGGRTIVTSPQLKVSVINTTNSKQANATITGAFHYPALNSNGTQTVIFTGNNLLGDPTTGAVFASGSFRYSFDPATGNITETLNGKGKLTPVCPLIQ